MRVRVKLAAAAVGIAALSMAAGPARAAGAATVGVAGPGASIAGFATPVIAVQVGGILPFVNADVTGAPHNICIKTSDGLRLLGCGKLIQYVNVQKPEQGTVSQDTPTDALVAGQTYPFYCEAHVSTMKGTIVALPGA